MSWIAVPVIYAPEAERDLDEITAYIAKDNPKAAEQFGYRLIARAELLGTFPTLGRPVHGERSVRVLLESPVRIYYRLGLADSFCGDSALLARITRSRLAHHGLRNFSQQLYSSRRSNLNDNVLHHTLMNTAGDGINELIIAPSPDLRPAPLFAPTRKAARRVLEFFTAQINNAHTRRAYLNATRRFADWCASKDIYELAQVQPFHVAAFVHDLQGELSPPSVKQHLAAIRMLFDWLVTGHVIETNPAHSVRVRATRSRKARRRS
jgi:plasmid stabilization system protein ParE